MCGKEKIDEKFLKDVPKEKHLEMAMENLSEAEFKFACFVNQFILYAKEMLKVKKK